jgi:hypothetical protein
LQAAERQHASSAARSAQISAQSRRAIGALSRRISAHWTIASLAAASERFVAMLAERSCSAVTM